MAEPAVIQLREGPGLEGELAGGESHFYEVNPRPTSPWHLTVEQRGVDVVVEVFGSEGRSLGAADSPLDRRGEEIVIVPAGGSGAFRVEVRSRDAWAPAGGYRIAWAELPDATVEDRQRLGAEEASTRAARHWAQDTPEGRRAALAAYRQAASLWREVGERAREARDLYCLAVLQRLVDEPRAALEVGETVLTLWRELGNHLWEAYTLNELGLVHHALGDNAAARSRFETSVARFVGEGDLWGEATARSNLCLLALARGELRDGVVCYQRVVELHEQVAELPGQAVALANAGRALDLLGESDRALANYERALEIRRSIGDRRGEAQVLNNLALLHRGLGEIREALSFYQQALEVFSELGDRRWQARTLHNLGSAYRLIGEPQRARVHFEQALPLRREVEDRRGEAMTLNGLSGVYRNLGEASTALGLNRQALTLQRAIDDRRGQALTLTLMGRELRELEQLPEAFESLQPALEIFREAGDRRNQAWALEELGRSLNARGDLQAAVVTLSEALELRRSVRSPAGEIQTLLALAEAERDAGALEAARAHAEDAVSLLESLRAQFASPELRASFFGSRRTAYELLIEMLMGFQAAEPGAGHGRAALAVSERARARVLLDLLRESGGVPVEGELGERWRAARRRLAARAKAETALLEGRHSEAEATAAERQVFAARAALEEVEAELRGRDARYAGLTHPSSVGAEAIQALLDGETLLLEYALGPERSFLWAVGREGIAVFELPGREVIEAAARRVHRALSTVDPRGSAEEVAAAAELSRWLLGPVAGRLAARRLVVVADGALHYLPFAALPVPAAEPGLGSTVPLIEDHELVQLPSASVLAELRWSSAGRRPGKGIAIFADPVFEWGDRRLAGVDAQAPGAASRAKPLPDLRRLPLTRLEAEAIVALAPPEPVRLAMGFEAHRALALGEEVVGYRILHFATHGLFNSAHPDLSGILLSQFDERGRPREGFIGLHDLYRAEVSAELVVLSGCQTALGREVRGEGLVGLTLGFMAAGVPRVVASLWRVEDRATAELMEHFYRGLWREGLPAAAALRQAQLSIRRQGRWRDPYYWAGFVLQGDWR